MKCFAIEPRKNNMQYIIAGFLFSVNAGPVSAGIYCTPPVAPSFFETKPTKPIKPFCLNEITNTHTCDEWIVSKYNIEVDTYNGRLREYQDAARIYIDELNSYLKKAREYAQCEVENL